MKIKEIVQEGLLDTIRRGADTLGRGVARSFDVQPDDEKFQQQQQIQHELKMRPQLPGMAADQFQKLLSNSGANLADPASYDANSVKQSLQDYAKQYFASTENKQANDYISKLINGQPLPANLTNKDILQYLTAANSARSAIVDRARAGTLQTIPTRTKPGAEAEPAPTPAPTPTQKTTPAPTPAPSPAPTSALPAEVSVLSSSPLVLQVGKRRFELDDADQWHPLGSKKTVSPGQAAILNKYLSVL